MIGREQPRTNAVLAQIIRAREFAFRFDINFGGDCGIHCSGGSCLPIAFKYATSCMISSSVK